MLQQRMFLYQLHLQEQPKSILRLTSKSILHDDYLNAENLLHHTCLNMSILHHKYLNAKTTLHDKHLNARDILCHNYQNTIHHKYLNAERLIHDLNMNAKSHNYLNTIILCHNTNIHKTYLNANKLLLNKYIPERRKSFSPNYMTVNHLNLLLHINHMIIRTLHNDHHKQLDRPNKPRSDSLP